MQGRAHCELAPSQRRAAFSYFGDPRSRVHRRALVSGCQAGARAESFCFVHGMRGRTARLLRLISEIPVHARFGDVSNAIV